MWSLVSSQRQTLPYLPKLGLLRFYHPEKSKQSSQGCDIQLSEVEILEDDLCRVDNFSFTTQNTRKDALNILFNRLFSH